MKKISLLAILLGTMFILDSGNSDDDNNPFNELKRRRLDSTPLGQGYDNGFRMGDPAGILDALKNTQRDLYKPLPAPTLELQQYTEGFAEGWNDAYQHSYWETIKKKINGPFK